MPKLRLCWVTAITSVLLHNLPIFTRGWIQDHHVRKLRKCSQNLKPQSTFIGGEYLIETLIAAYHHPLSASVSSLALVSESEVSPSTPLKIPILYESETVLAIHKPPHIAHHDSSTTMGILNHIRFLQNSTSTPPPFPYQGRIYGIHRLDRVTSGILVLAKTKQAAQALGKAFRDGRVTKYYVALSHKKPRKKKQGWVRGDMVRSRRKSWKLNATYEDPAVTRFFTRGLGDVIGTGARTAATTSNNTGTVTTTPTSGRRRQHGAPNPLSPKTLVLFRPHTGKTHQLRVAGKSLGLPILGDAVYGDAEDAMMTRRTYLHAAALHVHLDGEEIAIWCPPYWFDDFWADCEGNEGNDSAANEEDPIEDILVDMMQKHCDSEPICNLVFKRN